MTKNHFDRNLQIEIMELFQSLNDRGRTIVFVTHEPDIARYATRNVTFRDGHIYKESIVTNRSIAKEVLETLPIEQLDEID